MRIAYYTATMGGAGHLVRALAIHKGLRRNGFAGNFRCFGPEIPYEVDSGLDYIAARVSRAEQRDPALAQQGSVAKALAAFDPDVLLVDMFWTPIHAILPMLRAEAWLMLRTVPSSWLVGPPAVRFNPRAYARVFQIEPTRYHGKLDAIEPIVSCNPEELLPATALKEHLGVDPDQHITLVAQTGMEGEVGELATSAQAAGSQLVTLSLRDDNALFPLSPYLAGADRIIGGAGYNLYWETRWLGLADRTTCVPFKRSIDDQFYRAKLAQIPQHNGADQLAKMLMGR